MACVTLGDRVLYLGRHGTPESRAAYDRAVGEWMARGRTAPAPVPAGPDAPRRRVAVLVERF